MFGVAGTTGNVMLGGRWERGGIMPKPRRPWPPRGSYPHPAGGYVYHVPKRRGDRLQVTVHLRQEPDYQQLARALVELAREEAKDHSRKR